MAIRCYRLEDGTEVVTADQPVWCFACDSLRPGEWLDALGEIDELKARVAKLETYGLSENEIDLANFKQQDHAEFLADRLKQARAAVQWRSSRKSAPRCLVCASTHIAFLSDPNSKQPLLSFLHPGCEGTFTTDDDFHGMQSIEEPLDPEGLKLDV